MLTMKLTGLLAAATLALGVGTASAQTVVVGGKNFTEQQIMAEMTSQLLQAKGFKTDKRAGLGTAPLRQAQEAGQVDVYWEYTGTSLITFNKVTDKLDAAATYAKVKELDAAKGLVWLNPSKANNTYALAMRKADAEAKKIKTLSDLAAKVKGGEALKLASNAEFYARPGRIGSAAADLWLRVRPRERGAHGHGPRLPGPQGQAGRRRPGLCDGRPYPRLRFPRSRGRQGLLPELRPDAGRAQGNARQEPEARRASSTAFRRSWTMPRWPS